jgi:hypothetical protein
MRIYRIDRYLDVGLIKRVWRERTNIRLILNSDNYQFLKFARPGSYSSPIPDNKEIHASGDRGYRLPPRLLVPEAASGDTTFMKVFG